MPWDYEWLHDFAWGFADAPVSPMLALVEAAAQADAAEAVATHDPVEAAGGEYDDEASELEYDEEPLPPHFDAFRRKARINTYAVLGPELSLDDYPFYTPPPQGYPTIFGVNSGRTRPVAGERDQ